MPLLSDDLHADANMPATQFVEGMRLAASKQENVCFTILYHYMIYWSTD